MRQKPYVPTLINDNANLQKVWNDYQKSFVY